MEEPLIKAFNCADSLQQGSPALSEILEAEAQLSVQEHLVFFCRGKAAHPLSKTPPYLSRFWCPRPYLSTVFSYILALKKKKKKENELSWWWKKDTMRHPSQRAIKGVYKLTHMNRKPLNGPKSCKQK